MNWEILAVAYFFFILCVLPVSSARLRIVDFALVVGACGLLITGFLRLI
jgi:hypothetical protein